MTIEDIDNLTEEQKVALYHSYMRSNTGRTARNFVYSAIDTERDYQDRMWSENAPSDPRPLSIGEDLLLISEYLDRAKYQWSIARRPELEALEMVRKIAGIAVRCMENHGAPSRKL